MKVFDFDSNSFPFSDESSYLVKSVWSNFILFAETINHFPSAPPTLSFEIEREDTTSIPFYQGKDGKFSPPSAV